jgi:hypothetical protein
MGRLNVIGSTEEETGMELGNTQLETSYVAILYRVLNTIIFYSVTHRTIVNGYHSFGETYCLHLQGSSSNVKMEALSYS